MLLASMIGNALTRLGVVAMLLLIACRGREPARGEGVGGGLERDAAILAARTLGLAYLRSEQLAQAETAFRKIVDRKSTRLNSSHVKISYAVFCLKEQKAPDGARAGELERALEWRELLDFVAAEREGRAQPQLEHDDQVEQAAAVSEADHARPGDQ